MSFRRHLNELTTDLSDSSSPAVNAPFYFQQGGRLIGSSSSLPTINLGPPTNSNWAPPVLSVRPSTIFVNTETAIANSRIIRSRAGAVADVFNPLENQRENYLQNTSISSTYERISDELAAGVVNPISNDWIFNRDFYAGAYGVARNMGNSRAFQDSNANTEFSYRGLTEFMQFLENLVQKFILLSARELSDVNAIDSASYQFTQRMLSQPRDRINSSVRELFYRFYNSSDDGEFGDIYWNGDTRQIIERVVEMIQRHFHAHPEISNFLRMVPTLQGGSTRTVGGVRRWIYQLRQGGDRNYLMVLFAIVMIRLPSVNVARNGVMRDISGVIFLPIQYPTTTANERLNLELADANLRSLFYFIPEQRRVVGIWNDVAIVKDAPEDNERHPFYWQYKTDLLRTLMVRVQIPTEIRDNGGQLHFEYLFSNETNNLYRYLRETNPFNVSTNENYYNRYYVSLTVYANRQNSVLHIPWILEGSLTNGVAFDVSFFCQEYQRILLDTDSGRSLSDRSVDVDIFYFYFMLLNDPALPLSSSGPDTVAAPATRRPRRSPRLRNNQTSTSGIGVGAPYAGTPKEKHFLLGSMVNRFKNSAALFKVPARKLNTCLMMSLMKCQLYEYIFENGECVNILTTGTQRNNTCCFHVESLQDWSLCPRQYPFIEYFDSKYYIKLFNCSKYTDETTYVEGCLDQIEEDYWEKAAEEIWFHLENFFQRSINYCKLPEYGQAFADFFNVCICIYDVEMRGNRVHVISPFGKTPSQLVDENQKISLINIVYDQGHIHPITHLQAFLKAEARKDAVRLHNYCPICDKKQIQALRTTKECAMKHISECCKNKSFHIGFEKEEKAQSQTQSPEVKLQWRKNQRGKMCCYYACQSCFQEVHQHSYISHTCFIQPKKNEKIPDENIYVYDLECAQFIDEMGLYKHECNCLYIRKVYPMTEEEKLGQYYPTEIEFVNDLVSNPKFVNTVFIAHNGGNYDIHFILRILERREIAHSYVPSPTSKHKFIQIELIDQNIRFIDFMRFVPGSLKNIAEAFQIPVSKGDFPHKFNNGSHDTYCGRFPNKDTPDDYWNIHAFKSKSDESSFNEWYYQQLQLYCSCEENCSCGKILWDFQTEIKKYCLQDVIVLAEVVKAFREECMNFQSVFDEQYPDSTVAWNAPKLDPLQFMTLPQITIQTLVQGFSDPSVGIVAYNFKYRPGHCWQSLYWILQQQSSQRDLILHRGNCVREYYDFELNFHADGYCPQTNTIYIFLKCEYWACPVCYYEQTEMNELFSIRGLYASEIRLAYETLMHELHMKYKVVTIWEHDFQGHFASPRDIKLCELMKPQEAFYGGRTEVFQLYAHGDRNNSEIQYYDVTSLYPSVYAHHPLPIGRPTHVIGNDIDFKRFDPTSSNRYFGFARIFIVPKKTDLIGLLPQRDKETGRLFFPVIPMEGCWGTEEIYLAMQNGYEIKEIYEVYYWEPDQYSDQHLRGYVGYFLRMKQEAEGWKKLGATSETPDEEEKQRIVHQLYIQNGNLGKIRADKVSKNAVKRQLAKLYLNALWGKFAQKSSKTQHTTVYGTQQFLDVWHDKRIDQSSCQFREISPGVYKASYNLKEEFINPVRHGNVFIAAKVTETARCVLHKQMLKIGPEKIIYCDTDSIIFLWDRISQLTGVGLGKWTNEYPNHKIEQVYALAPKLYSLTLKKNDSEYESFRAKGVQMTLTNQERMSFNRVKPLIESVMRKDEIPLTTAVNNFTIFTNSGNNALPYGQVYTRYNEKQVRAIITKRIFKEISSINWEEVASLQTYPLGFEIK